MFESKHRTITLHLARVGAALFLGPLTLGLTGCGISYEFDPATVGDDHAGRAPEPRTNSQYIRAVYADILGRAPEVYDFSIEDAQGNELIKFPIQEQVNLVGALDSTGDPDALRAVVTAGLLGSAEVKLPSKSSVDDPRAFIREQFRALLGREPNAYEAYAFEDAWKNDAAVGPRAVIRAIVGSREYQSR
jgi:hypothetical protein